MGRVLVALLILSGFALPALAEDAPDCSIWNLRGIRLGMAPKEAMGTRKFRETRHPQDPPEYRRYVWESRSRPEKIDMHVDMSVDPPRIIGAGTSIFGPEISGELFVSSFASRWGPPQEEYEQGGFVVHTWNSPECDVDIRVSVLDKDRKLSFFVAMTSISGHREFTRRKREAEAAGGSVKAEPDTPTDVDEAAPEEPEAGAGSGGDDSR